MVFVGKREDGSRADAPQGTKRQCAREQDEKKVFRSQRKLGNKKKKESCRKKKTVKLEVIGGATGNYPGVGAKER